MQAEEPISGLPQPDYAHFTHSRGSKVLRVQLSLCTSNAQALLATQCL